MSVYGLAKRDDASWAPNALVFRSTPASNTTLANGDYSQLDSTAVSSSSITYASWSTSGYNDWAFDSGQLSAVVKAGISKLGVKNNNYDNNNSAPSWVTDSISRITGYYADQTGTTNDPKLVVTYTPGVDSAAVTGTATSGFTENDVIASGDTIIITLSGDTFIS
jgi:hypothetical protein